MRTTAVSFCLLLLGGCTVERPPAAASPIGSLTLSVVSTNDVHGQLERLPVFAGFVQNLRRARQTDGGVVLVDAGDAFQGTIESNLNEGAAVIAAYGKMGYSALALGNHEFDFGPEGPAAIASQPGDDPEGALRKRIAEATFPVLSANLVTDEGHAPAWKNLSSSTEAVVAGVHVGIIGLLTIGAPDVIKRPDFSGLHVTPLADAATREARALRARGATVVIVVAHAGGECQRVGDPHDLTGCNPESELFRLAHDVPRGLIDGIFGGHLNSTVAHVVAGIPIVQTTSSLVAFSRVDFVLDAKTGRVVSTRVEAPHPVCVTPMEQGCRPGVYEGAPVVPDTAVANAIRPALDAARAVRDQPLGVRVEARFPVEKTQEMALGNLFADLMREAMPGADAAMGNAGSVRDDLPAGELTFGQVHHVMPFDNQLARVALTGKELRAIIAENLTDGEHGLLSLSGITVDATCQGSVLEVTLKHPDGAAVRDDEALTVATNDYLAFGGDGLFTALHVPNGSDRTVGIDTRTTVLGALIDGLKKRRTLRPDAPALLDPKHPRMRFPGPLPVHCGTAR